MNDNPDSMSQYIETATGYYRSFDPSRPDGLAPQIDIARGDKILVIPEEGQGNGKCWLATEANIERFRANGFNFVKQWTEATRKSLNDIGAQWAGPFGNAIAFNLSPTSGHLKVPSMNLPWWVSFFYAWPLTLRFNQTEDVTKKRLPDNDTFLKALCAGGVIPNPYGDVAKNDLKILRYANFVRIYELRKRTILFRVFAFFVTPMDKDGTVGQADTKVRNTLLEFAKQVKDNALKDNAAAPPNATIVILGTPKGWDLPERAIPERRPDFLEVRVAPPQSMEGAWQVDCPPYSRSGSIYRNFIYALIPETEPQRTSRIDDLLTRTMQGYGTTKSFSVSEVAELTGDPEELVARTFDELLKIPGKYMVEELSGVHYICKGSGTNSKRHRFGKYAEGGEGQSWLSRNCMFIALTILCSPLALKPLLLRLPINDSWCSPLIYVIAYIVGPVLKQNTKRHGQE